MEDGPYLKTRSSAGKTSENDSTKGSVSSDVFSTPNRLDEYEGNKAIKALERQRTPSGSLITHSVGDIRNFFIQKSPRPCPYQSFTDRSSKNNSQEPNYTLCGQSSQDNEPQKSLDRGNWDKQTQKPRQSVFSVLNRGVTDQIESNRNRNVNKQLSFTPDGKGVNATNTASKETEFQKGADQPITVEQTTACEVVSDNHTLESDKIDSASKQVKDQREEMAQGGSINGAQEDKMTRKLEEVISGDPKAMDLKLVLEMFKEIKK